MSISEPAAIEAWKGAIGRSETRHEVLEAESLRRYALAVGTSPEIERESPPLPHWAHFLPRPADTDIGVDGHLKRGGFLPDIALPRRMFASADIYFETPLEIGSNAEMVNTIISVTHKPGKSGDLVFVEADRVISQRGVLRIRERQTYVFREVGEPLPLPRPLEEPPAGEVWHPTAVNLFRFSAATFNSHRIHYDLPYAVEAEGYPALVVHGPFTAAKLAGFAASDGVLRRFKFRATSPIFLGQPVWLQRSEGEVRATRCDGATAMIAEVQFQ